MFLGMLVLVAIDDGKLTYLHTDGKQEDKFISMFKEYKILLKLPITLIIQLQMKMNLL